jgi:hypothetical protein
MQTIAVFVNDPAHAHHVLQPMLAQGEPARWLLVACPPVLTRHIGRWLSQAARRQWRERWSAELFERIEPAFGAPGKHRLERVVAQRPITEVAARLQARHPGLQLLDARCPRLGQPAEPIVAGQPPTDPKRWPVALAATGGLSLMLALAD